MLKSGSTSVTQSSESQLEAREQLWQSFSNAPLDDAEKERNLGLFIRSASLARMLAISDLYREIVHLPGSVLDFRNLAWPERRALRKPQGDIRAVQ